MYLKEIKANNFKLTKRNFSSFKNSFDHLKNIIMSIDNLTYKIKNIYPYGSIICIILGLRLYDTIFNYH